MSDPWTITLPNIRSMIVPDPGFVLVEADLARADAQVCAWDSGCEDLKAAFQRGDDIHSDNARWLYGRDINPRTGHINGMSFRDNAKRAVHLANYAGGYQTLAQSCALQEQHAASFLHWWTLTKHPAIGEWHDRKAREIRSRKTPVATNAFGFRRIYTDRTDRLLGQVLAWICQSTVSVVINKALLRFHNELPEAQLLLQVHDSVLMQIPSAHWPALAPAVTECMKVVVPYPHPLIIPSEIKWSASSWGEMEKWVGE